jgi:hypothetical protein
MADSLGFKSKGAFKKDPGLNATAPTGLKAYPHTPGATDMSASHQIPFTSESFTKSIERSFDPALIGGQAISPAPIVAEDSAGSLGGRLRWRGWERLIYAVMGFEHADNSAKQLGGVAAYAHLFELDEALMDRAFAGTEKAAAHANDRKARRGQFGIAKQVEDWVWNSVMFDKMTITGTPTETNIEFDGTAYGLYRGSYNSGNWALPSGSTAQALFRQCTIRLDTRATGDPLTLIEPSSFELTLENALKTDDRTTESGVNIIQPDRDSFRAVSLKLEYPRHYSGHDLDMVQADINTEYACSIVFDGPTIVGAQNYKMGFYMSSLWWKGYGAPIDGAGPVKTTFEFTAARPGGADIFETNHYQAIGLVKDSGLVCMIHNDDSFQYIDEL